MKHKNSFLTRFFIICVALLMAALPTMQAAAALRACRTDPIFWLSNGEKLTVVLDVSANASEIAQFYYVVHVPPGVTVTKVTYTKTSLGIPEPYKVVQDGTAKIYHTDVLVTLKNKSTSPVSVVATAKLSGNIGTVSVSGISGKSFRITAKYP
jgi:hypothetical protein